MAFVITDACIRCKYTDCVDVCPVDCFREGPNTLVIDPDECIDCELCVPQCPIDAIFSIEDLPEDKKEFIEINAELSKTWPAIVTRKDPLPDAEDWKNIPNKVEHLEVKWNENK